MTDFFMLFPAACAILAFFALARGRNAFDKVLSLASLGAAVILFCAIGAVATGREYYLHVAIAWLLLTFIGNIALIKFLEGKGFDE